ncbi:RNA methyltransferase [Rufibacter glacialis]|uniref:RNA methyltransferase n=1 Tax=Rufibacter glacialis TaxID=1259555 RepID=A0A5M8QHL4_9BACT|nr:RNA methyltransferase [Rufibacter glacialis]KAA6434276.1 RNA methyltransferase [Rufibacter glacialis]GGK68226.1 RNA methyltransferase [Rufibacter glacialis]
MISKGLLKYIRSLQIKKYRLLHQAFTVEGEKSVAELLRSDFELETLFATQKFLNKHTLLLLKGFEVVEVGEEELSKAGAMETNNAALAIAKMRPASPFDWQEHPFVLALDEVRDPGNLGTIIRIADWYGLSSIVLSENSADFYNQKVIAATMGSFTRVLPHYVDLNAFLENRPENVPVYGAALEGENVHRLELQPAGVLIMGNESNGIRPETMQQVTQPLHIPGRGGAESLNVGTATAILLDNFFRNL